MYMINIVTQLTANNQISIRYVDRAANLKQKNKGDTSAITEDSVIAKYQKRTEDIIDIIANAHIEYYHDNNTTTYADIEKALSEGMYANIDNNNHTVNKYYKACYIPSSIEYEEVTAENRRIVKTTRACLVNERLSILDIISKSQQVKRYERPWGKLQTTKTFTTNAKQKILEAGAVVDMHYNPDCRYELTLTIPGSGLDVYDVVSRYSGYIVNRLTQIVRRWEAKGADVGWFFVWEHQERGALHMHWCIAVDGEPMLSDYLCRQLRAKWYELLEELSVKTHTDLFKKRGFSGTWRYSPEVWQSNISVVRKSIAAYFSKYMSKNVENSRLNRDRGKEQTEQRIKHPNRLSNARVFSIHPSRYWGSSSRIKSLCKRYRVSVSFAVASDKEGNYVAEAIEQWVSHLQGAFTKVSRSFRKACPITDFVYCEGWESKLWFDSSLMPQMVRLFKFIKTLPTRKTDAIGAVSDMNELLEYLTGF